MPNRTIDANMEQASQKLVARDYFACEKLCSDALAAAFGAKDYERMSRILMPLQEARRQKRQIAEDADRIIVIERDAPTEAQLGAGVYVIRPPRVAAEARALREHLDRLGIASAVITREPTTRAGKIPIVAIGPTTLREHLTPPPIDETMPQSAKGQSGQNGQNGQNGNGDPMHCHEDLPLWWLLWACEQLGDGAIADAMRDAKAGQKRVEQLYFSLQALPEHDKLHQVLAEACLEASRMPAEPVPTIRDDFDDDRDEPDEIGA